MLVSKRIRLQAFQRLFAASKGTLAPLSFNFLAACPNASAIAPKQLAQRFKLCSERKTRRCITVPRTPQLSQYACLSGSKLMNICVPAPFCSRRALMVQ